MDETQATKQIQEDSLFPWHLLQETAVFLWKDWPKEMEAVWIDQTKFSMRGDCPHSGCKSKSVFFPVGGPYQEQLGPDHRGQVMSNYVLVAQCQGCKKYILGIAKRGHQESSYTYVTHYPLGEPDDDVASEIPEAIKADFQEALRCLWVKAYNATAEMCRRAVEASCINLGAPRTERSLEDKIDWLETQRQITPFLRDVAHKIRLGGNRAAHPGNVPSPQPPGAAIAPEPDPELPITKEHAEAIVKFTREFFHHVYVVPKQLDKYDFSKPKTPSVTATASGQTAPAPELKATRTVGGAD